jgi:ketol-acid reductoisomerase
MVAMVKAGVELAFEAMTDGIIAESAYESLHETPLIANTIAEKLFEMNRVISDTAEWLLFI